TRAPRIRTRELRSLRSEEAGEEMPPTQCTPRRLEGAGTELLSRLDCGGGLDARAAALRCPGRPVVVLDRIEVSHRQPAKRLLAVRAVRVAEADRFTRLPAVAGSGCGGRDEKVRHTCSVSATRFSVEE